MADIQGIVDQIKGLTLLEASELVKAMEETFGVSAAAAVAAAPAAAAGGGEAAVAFVSGQPGKARVAAMQPRLARQKFANLPNLSIEIGI